MADVFTHASKKIQTVEPSSPLFQGLEQLSEFQSQLTDHIFSFYRNIDNHMNHLKNYSRNEVLSPLKEFKKSYEKTNSKYQSEFSKSKKVATSAEKTRSNYAVQFNDMCANIKLLDQKLSFQWLEHVSILLIFEIFLKQ